MRLWIWLLLIVINSINSIYSTPLYNNSQYLKNIEYKGIIYTLFESNYLNFYYSNSSSNLLFIKNGQIESIGWDVDHYGLQHSAYAVWDSTIYSFGGYGFWHQNNVLRYFDFTNGWIPVILEGNSMIEPCHSSAMVVIKNGLNIIGGQRASLDNPLLTEDILNWYHIDMNSKKVRKYVLKYPINSNNIIAVTNDSIFWQMENGFTGMFVMNSNAYYVLEKNEIYYQYFKDENFSIKGGKIVSGSKIIDLTRVFKFKRIESDQIWVIAIVLLIFVVLFLGFVFGRNKKLEADECIIETSSLENLTIDQLKFLNILIVDGAQTGTEVMAFIDSGYISLSNLYKKRRDFIRAINNLLNYTLIVEKSNPSDTRSKVFYINEEISKTCLINLEKAINERLG